MTKYKEAIATFICGVTVLIYFIVTLNNPYFNPKNFLNHINTFTSSEYKGRLTGDIGAKKASKYIQKEFKKNNISPLSNSNDYVQKFPLNNVHITGDISFKAYDARGNLFKEYLYGKDFKEVPFGMSSKGTVKGSVSTSIGEKSPILFFNQNMIGESENDYILDDILISNDFKACIYTGNDFFRFRTPYKLQKSYDKGLIKIMVNSKVSKEIPTLLKTGATFEIKTGIENKNIYGENILGVIKGEDSLKPPIVLSAHYDHVGFDIDNVIYPGALDNASGISFLMEAAKILKNSNPKRDIIIAAFDGEEVGLLGSEYFASNSLVNIKKSKVINFDMVGTTKNIPLSVLSSNDNSLSKEVLDLMKKNNIKSSKLLESNSDHASFESVGVDAVTLIHDDMDKIHTPLDTIENINEEKIIDVFYTLKSFLTYNDIIDDKSFNIHTNSSKLNFYSTYILLSFITLLFLNLLLYLRRKGWL